jgi:hypothetical protein
MKMSPHYDAIKARALELLRAEGGFNSHSLDELRRDTWLRHNNIGVALCVAHDEIAKWPRLEEYASTAKFHAACKAVREARFTKANFRKAEAEINRVLR